jgi:hypothetical protein
VSHVPKVFVAPRVNPEWVSVTREDSCSSSFGFGGRSIHEAPDEIRCDSYGLDYGEESPHWREATPDEVALALWSVLFEEDE